MVPNPAPVGEEPTSQVLEGQVLEGQAPEGQALEGQVLEGQVLEGQVLEGQVPESKGPEGQGPEGQALKGQALERQGPEGQSPERQVLQNQVFRGQAPPGLPLAEGERMAARGATQGFTEEGLGGCGPEATPAIAAEAVVAADLAGAGDGCATQPMVRRIEAGSVDGGEARADQRFDAFSAMPRPPMLDAGIEVAWRLAPPPGMTAPAERAAAAEAEPSAHARGIAADRPAAQGASARASVPTAKGMEPLTSALDVAQRLAADASVAAEALENLNRLLQHKQQLEGLRSAHVALARPAEG